MAFTRAATFPSVSGTTTAAVTIQAIGDLVVAWSTTGLSGQTVTNMTDTNNRVDWHQLIVDNEGWSGEHVAMWWGTALSTGATTVTPVFTAGTPTFAHMAVDSWTGSASGWAVDSSGVTSSGSLTATLLYPSLSVSSEPAVYLGYMIASATFSNTATSGFSSSRSANTEVASNPAVTVAGSPYAPTDVATTTASFDGQAAIFKAAPAADPATIRVITSPRMV